jgi:hypothetical protein
LAKRVDTLAKKVRARAAREKANLACTFVHEDFDKTDSGEVMSVRDRVQRSLEKELGTAHYVLSVAEIEAWLLLFPEALANTVSSWKVPKQLRNRDTGTIANPKEVLIRTVSNRSRRYRESDAPDVFAKAIGLNCLDRAQGRNRSWSQFRADAAACGQLHLQFSRRL